MIKLFLFFYFFCSTVPSFVSPTSFSSSIRPVAQPIFSEPIQIGWPVQGKLSTVGDGTSPSGYSYEYLMRIKQYTGWDYNFHIEEDGDDNQVLLHLLEELKSGDIQILGNLTYSSEAAKTYNFNYATFPYCSSSMTLTTSIANTDLYNVIDLTHAKNPLTIALLSTATKTNEAVKTFLTANNIVYNDSSFIYCASQEEQMQKVTSGEADLLPIVDFMIPSSMRMVAKYNATPLYFAVSKQYPEVLTALNQALVEIDYATPYFKEQLYKKYFESNTTSLIFSEQERNFIASSLSIPVHISPFGAPFQYVDEKGKLRGITVELLAAISKKSGLSFQYQVTSEENYLLQTQLNPNALIASLSFVYDISDRYQTLLTSPYITAHMVLLANTKLKDKNPEQSIVAIVKGDSTSELTNYQEIKQFNTIKECLEATNNGDCDFVFGDSYSISHYSFRSNYRNLISLPTLIANKEYSIAVPKKANQALYSILNKVLRSMSESEIFAIVVANIDNSRLEFSLSRWIQDHTFESIFIALGIGCVLAIIVALIFNIRLKANKRLYFEAKRYAEFAELSGEYLLEYDCIKDRLTCTSTCSILLNIPRVIENYSNHTVYQHYQGLDFLQGEKEIQIPTANQTLQWFRVFTSVVEDQNKPIYILSKLLSIQEEKEEKELLILKSRKDDLSDLLKIGSFKEDVEESIQNLNPNSRAFFIFDIDKFKDINDTYGHYEGDQVICTIAKCLKEIFSQTEFIGRLGGDEFVVYIENKTKLQVERLASKFHTSLKTVFKLSFPYTVSCGICFTKQKNISYDLMYQIADKVLYKAKELGRDRFEVFFQKDEENL